MGGEYNVFSTWKESINYTRFSIEAMCITVKTQIYATDSKKKMSTNDCR